MTEARPTHGDAAARRQGARRRRQDRPGRDGSTNSAELYDPGSGTWSATGSMHGARDGHTATLLQNGTVLVAGGRRRGQHGERASHGGAVRPEHRDVDDAGDMLEAGGLHTATLLRNGQVLVVGSPRQPECCRAVRPEHRDLDRYRVLDLPRTITRRRCCPMARCSWQAAAERPRNLRLAHGRAV